MLDTVNLFVEAISHSLFEQRSPMANGPTTCPVFGSPGPVQAVKSPATTTKSVAGIPSIHNSLQAILEGILGDIISIKNGGVHNHYGDIEQCLTNKLWRDVERLISRQGEHCSPDHLGPVLHHPRNQI